MITLLQQVMQWWFILFLLCVIALPFTVTFFGLFFDKGYAFSKIIGLIALSYLMLVAGTLHILPFSTISLFILLAFMIGFSLVFAKKNHTVHIIKIHWRLFLFEELLFFVGLFFWSYIKSFQPDIHGLEKFMDFGFVNSILRTSYFPPKDMWMTPLSINYYYFGHLMTAVATRLSFLPSNITFNLMLASLLGLTLSEGFSLGANLLYLLKKQTQQAVGVFPLLVCGLFAALLLTFGGNLHTLYTFFTPYQNESPVPPTSLVFSPITFPNQYWYPNATRFIYHTIHEFPIYSFVVSDLHGHVLDIPAVLLMIGILLTLFLQKTYTQKKIFITAGLLGFLTAIMYMTNAWDGLIYVGVSAVLLYAISFTTGYLQTLFSRKVLISFLILFSTFIFFGLPFSIFFKPFASQIGLNCAPEFLIRLGHIGPLVFENGYCQTSPLWQLAILYGFFFFWFVSLLAFLFVKNRKEQLTRVDEFVVAMGALGFLLIILPEFVYLKDIYTTYFRANTMFKLVYQSFMLLMLVSSYAIFRISSAISFTKRKGILKQFAAIWYILIGSLLVGLVFLYPYFAINAYFNNLKEFHGLDGTIYLKNISVDDYNAIRWINKNIYGQPVLLEAQGDSYTDYERISSNTGLPTVFGWLVHEWLWRGTYDVVPPRVADVKMLYESTDISQTKKLLQKYHVAYVYFGDLERSKYTVLDEKKFETLGSVIYKTGNVRIYKIK